MKSKDIVFTLGYVAIFCIALYLVFGLLKISGNGLTSITDDSVVEGMSNRQLKKTEDLIEKGNDYLEKELSRFSKDENVKNIVNFDDISGADDYQENATQIMKVFLEIQKNKLLESFINKNSKKQHIGFTDKATQNSIDNILRFSNFIKFLEEHESVDL